MKVLLASVLLLSIFGVADSAPCSRSRRASLYPRYLSKSRNRNVTEFLVLRIYPADINETFIVKVDNAFVDGETTLQPRVFWSRGSRSKKPEAKVTSVNEETGEFSLELTEYGKQQLKYRVTKMEKYKRYGKRIPYFMRPTLKVGVGIVFSKQINPKDRNAPKFAEFRVGNFSCTGAKCGLPADGCAALFKSKYKNGWDMEEGTANLPITPSSERFSLKIGFETPVHSLDLTCKLRSLGTNECRKVWKYATSSWYGELNISKYLIRVQPREEIPPVSYIEYEDRVCKTTCGTEPVCAPPPTEEPTEEPEEPEEPEELEEPTEELEERDEFGTNLWDEFEVNK